MNKELRARLSLTNPVHFCALGFGSGLMPFAPGTFGTLAGMPLVALATFLPHAYYLAITLAVCVVGIYLCGRTAHDMQVHDHGSIVWDEIAGILLTFVLVPFSLTTAIVGFVLFRFFDMVKPWPISYLDKHGKGGFGIMVDDVVAGILACLCLHGLLHWGVL